MRRGQRLLVAAGIVSGAVAIVVAARPELAAGLGISRLFVTLLGALAFVQGLRSIQARRDATIEGATTPDPEERLETPLPGDDFDETLGRLATRRNHRWLGGDYDRVRRRLRDAAVSVLVSRVGLTPEAARERVADGTWTDDPVAAFFLGDEVPPPPLAVRIRAFLRTDYGFGIYAERAADAVAALEAET